MIKNYYGLRKQFNDFYDAQNLDLFPIVTAFI